MTELTDEWEELGARAGSEGTGPLQEHFVDLTRGDNTLVSMRPEEAMLLAAALCEAARKAIRAETISRRNAGIRP